MALSGTQQQADPSKELITTTANRLCDRVDKKTLRLAVLLPLSIICNSLFLFIAARDFQSFFFVEEEKTTAGIRTTVIKFTTVTPDETPLLFYSFAAFGLVLFVDTVFILIALCEEGRKKLPVIGGSLVHHVGMLGWILNVAAGGLPYSTGIAYCLFLLEFCFPLRILVNLVYRKKEKKEKKESSEEEEKSSNGNGVSPKILWQFKVFMLDMFMSGGGTFAAIFVYLLSLSAETLNAKARKDIFYTYLFCILYWFVQLATLHRASQNRLIEKAAKEAADYYKEEAKKIDFVDCESDAEDTALAFSQSASGSLSSPAKTVKSNVAKGKSKRSSITMMLCNLSLLALSTTTGVSAFTSPSLASLQLPMIYPGSKDYNVVAFTTTIHREEVNLESLTIPQLQQMQEELEIINNRCTEEGTQTNAECDIELKDERNYAILQIQVVLDKRTRKNSKLKCVDMEAVREIPKLPPTSKKPVFGIYHGPSVDYLVQI